MVDLFAGCGGLTRGFLESEKEPGVSARYKVLAAVESDRAAAATYAANFGRDHLYPIKIENWHNDIPRAEVVVGGPPCQGFSNLGRRDPDDPRNTLWREYARTLEQIQPDYFLIENVAAFYRSPQWELLQEEVINGPLSDYRLQPWLLDAAEFGVPQRRKRAVVLGRRADMPGLPAPIGHLAGSPASFNTVEQALAVLERSVPEENVDLPDGRYEYDGTEFPGAFKTSQLHITRAFEEVSRRRMAAIPHGGSRADLPDELLAPCWRKHRTGSMDVMGRLHASKPSVTIRTEFFKPEKGRYLHPTEDRALTHAEAALLQTFPIDYQWCGSKVAIARQIGNAVPVLLARSLGALIARQYA